MSGTAINSGRVSVCFVAITAIILFSFLQMVISQLPQNLRRYPFYSPVLFTFFNQKQIQKPVKYRRWNFCENIE